MSLGQLRPWYSPPSLFPSSLPLPLDSTRLALAPRGARELRLVLSLLPLLSDLLSARYSE